MGVPNCKVTPDRRKRVGGILKSVVGSRKVAGPHREVIDQVSIFGCDHKCQWYGSERDGVANARYLHCGSRSVLIYGFFR